MSSETSQPKIGFFNGKKLAEKFADDNLTLQAESERLQHENGQLRTDLNSAQVVLEQFGIEDVPERQRRIASLIADISAGEEELRRLHVDTQKATAGLVEVRQSAEMQSLGLFDYEHPAETSAELADELSRLRAEIKTLNKVGEAISATSNFTFNNSQAQGRKMVKDYSRLMLRAYNAEVENCVKTVRAGNLHTAQARLQKAVDQIAKTGAMLDIKVTARFHRLRLKELELAARHLERVKEEKDAERAHKAELREQRKAEQELQREHDRLEKEKSHYLNSLAALEAKGDIAGVERLRTELLDVERALEDVDYRAANIRAGYVYVISNLGAFGENMVKIGMTRRLEPMDRIRELSDASVPFHFDVHALFFSKDAVGVETMLHQTFAPQRVNKVNLRREFFNTTPDAVLDVLKTHSVEVLEFDAAQKADEYRTSWPELAAHT